MKTSELSYLYVNRFGMLYQINCLTSIKGLSGNDWILHYSDTSRIVISKDFLKNIFPYFSESKLTNYFNNIASKVIQ